MARKRKLSASDILDYANTSSDSEYSESNVKRPVARNAANARERARMRVLSKAFTKLKTSLPWVPADTKLSKLDTLRLAASYISHLRQILAEDQTYPTNSIHPLNLTWPFTLHNRPLHHEDTDHNFTSAAFTYIHNHQWNSYEHNDRSYGMPFKASTPALFQTYQQELINEIQEYN